MTHQSNLYFLGINLGYAVNRYPEPEDWIETLREIGVRRVQFVADLLNPALPASIRYKKIERIKELAEQNNIVIESAFTGAFTRVNHFGSQDEEVREYWLTWFIEYAKQMSLLGATSIGGHPGILSLKDDSDLDKRDIRIREIALNWQRLFEVIEPLGIKTILWEPMSISREIGHTIEDAAYFQDILDKVGGSHFKICLDLDHGDLESPNKDDINPLAWIRAFRNQIGALHLKQTSIDRRKHMPFTPANNAIGTVNAKHIMSALSENAVKSITMYLELGFRERNPDDKKAIEDTKLSVEYWKQSGAQVN